MEYYYTSCNFRSDIWYCNILAYYLDNYTQYDNDINVILSR